MRGNNNLQSFRLMYLKLFNHPVLGNFNIDFLNYDTIEDEPTTTLLIGSNGTGKSELLRVLIDVFRELQYMKSREKKVSIKRHKYELKYKINNDAYYIKSHGKSKKTLTRNNQLIDIFSLMLPDRLLASTFILNDKFLFQDPEIHETKKSFYHYLGIRRSPGTAGTRTFIKRVVDYIITSSDDKIFLENLSEVLRFLGLEERLTISFTPRFKKDFFDKKISVNFFKNFFEKWREFRPNRETEPYSINYYEKLSENDILNMVEYINRIQNKIFEDNGKDKFLIDIEFNDIFRNKYIKKDYDLVKKLMDIDILSYPSIKIYKKFGYTLDQASSGENHFLSTILSILSEIKQGSLVLIDEPENSFHPNWQIKYVEFLKKIFAKYSSCHFIIATHSHFMVSDQRIESSSIVLFNKDEKNNIISTLNSKDTFGWSAEEILYRIFNLPTTRNYYLASELGDILNLISRNEENTEQEIKSKISNLKNLNLQDEDPLKKIITELLIKYGE